MDDWGGNWRFAGEKVNNFDEKSLPNKDGRIKRFPHDNPMEHYATHPMPRM
jgi:hypothetical protein